MCVFYSSHIRRVFKAILFLPDDAPLPADMVESGYLFVIAKDRAS